MNRARFRWKQSKLQVSPEFGAWGPCQGSGDFAASNDRLVRFPLGVLWFDDELAHFKRSPQPVFDRDTMISRPKNWHVQRSTGSNKFDYPLLPPVLSDIYTGRVLDDSERSDLRKTLKPSSPTKLEPSQYRLKGQPGSTKPGRLVVGRRVNPLTGETEARAFPKTYGCDGGIDYGGFFTLRSGTAAYYDKTIESGTVFLSGPRSGCTNSIIPSGGLLNVPYYYDGCTCSYPLPIAMSLVAMPQSHEQWSSWGSSEIKPGKLQRIGINFGAPGDRMTRDGTLWLDYPSVGGPSPKANIEATTSTEYHYQHSLWMQNDESRPWVSASMAEGLERFVNTTWLEGVYTFHRSVRLTVKIPFIDQRRDVNQNGLPEYQSTSGVGDIVIGLPLKRYSNHRGMTQNWSITPSLRIPTGSSSGDFPISDGSLDAGLSLSFSRETPQFYQLYDLYYWKEGAGKRGMQTGDSFGLDVNLGIHPWHSDETNSGIFLMWDLSASHSDAPNQLNLTTAAGGDRVYTGPVFVAYRQNLMFRVEYKFLAYERVINSSLSRGDQLSVAIGAAF